MSRGCKPRISNKLAITKQSKKHINCQKVSAFDGFGVVFNFVARLKPLLRLNFAQRCENLLVNAPKFWSVILLTWQHTEVHIMEVV